MTSQFNLMTDLRSVFFLIQPLVAALGGIAIGLSYFIIRRIVRRARIRQYETRAIQIHEKWREIVRGEIPAESWCRNRMQRQIVLSIVVQEIAAANSQGSSPGFRNFFARTG